MFLTYLNLTLFSDELREESVVPEEHQNNPFFKSVFLFVCVSLSIYVLNLTLPYISDELREESVVAKEHQNSPFFKSDFLFVCLSVYLCSLLFFNLT